MGPWALRRSQARGTEGCERALGGLTHMLATELDMQASWVKRKQRKGARRKGSKGKRHALGAPCARGCCTRARACCYPGRCRPSDMMTLPADILESIRKRGREHTGRERARTRISPCTSLHLGRHHACNDACRKGQGTRTSRERARISL